MADAAPRAPFRAHARCVHTIFRFWGRACRARAEACSGRTAVGACVQQAPYRALNRYECKLIGWSCSSRAWVAPTPGNATWFLRDASVRNTLPSGNRA